MTRPLIAAPWRPGAIVVIVLGAALTAWLSVLSYHAASTAFDDWALRSSAVHLGPRAARFLSQFSEPGLSLGVIVIVALGAALARHWRLFALAAVAPGLSIVLTEYVLKPAIDRYVYLPGIPQETLQRFYSGAFPSGHETGVASAALLVLVAFGQLRLPAAARAAIVAGLASWLALAAAGLVRNAYHYATDTIGSVGLSAAVVLGTAMVIDLVHTPIAQRADRRREPAVEVS
jgi:PAP2 superfamily protein